jgi:hypothetical protein
VWPTNEGSWDGDSSVKRPVHVTPHYRNGKPVKGYSQHREAWKQAASSGSLAAASGLTAVFLVIEVGFTAVSTIAIIVLALLSVVAGSKTVHTIAPNRTKGRPRPRTSRSAPGSKARRRAYSRKARWRARRRKTAKWTRRKALNGAMATARAAGRGWRRARGRQR